MVEAGARWGGSVGKCAAGSQAQRGRAKVKCRRRRSAAQHAARKRAPVKAARSRRVRRRALPAVCRNGQRTPTVHLRSCRAQVLCVRVARYVCARFVLWCSARARHALRDGTGGAAAVRRVPAPMRGYADGAVERAPR